MALSAPSNLHVLSDGNDGHSLAWDAVSGISGYRVYRATASGTSTADYTFIAEVPSGTTTYIDTGVTLGEVYYYRVTAYVKSFQFSDPGTTGSKSGEGWGYGVWSAGGTAEDESSVSNEVAPVLEAGQTPTAATVVAAGRGHGVEETGWGLDFTYDDQPDITVPQTAIDAINNGEYTILFWVRGDSEDGSTDWPDYINGPDAWRWEENQDGITRVGMYVDDQTVTDGVTQAHVGEVSHNPGEVHSVGFGVSAGATSGTVDTYKNGSLVNSDSSSHPGKDNQNTVSDVVWEINSAPAIDGAIDRISFYNRKLTDSEVDAWHQGNAPGSGLVMDYQFNEGPGGTPTDSISGNTGTLGGAVYKPGLATDSSPAISMGVTASPTATETPTATDRGHATVTSSFGTVETGTVGEVGGVAATASPESSESAQTVETAFLAISASPQGVESASAIETALTASSALLSGTESTTVSEAGHAGVIGLPTATDVTTTTERGTVATTGVVMATGHGTGVETPTLTALATPTAIEAASFYRTATVSGDGETDADLQFRESFPSELTRGLTWDYNYDRRGFESDWVYRSGADGQETVVLYIAGAFGAVDPISPSVVIDYDGAGDGTIDDQSAERPVLSPDNPVTFPKLDGDDGYYRVLLRDLRPSDILTTVVFGPSHT